MSREPTNEVVQPSYQRLATKRSISSNRRGRNYRYNSYYWVPRHVKIENGRRADEIDIHGTNTQTHTHTLRCRWERVFSLLDYRLTSISCFRPSKPNFTMRARHPRLEQTLTNRVTDCKAGLFLLRARGHAKVKRRERRDGARGEVIKNREIESEQ